MKALILFIAISIGFFAHAERQHSIELSGALLDPKVNKLTVDSLNKDFPNLSSVSTEWRAEGVKKFEGVLFKDLLAKYAAQGVAKAKVTATNAYSQVLIEKDIQIWGALLAYKQDGQVIPTKDKGTFRVVYDFKKYEKDATVKPVLEGNAVWQVIKIEFIK